MFNFGKKEKSRSISTEDDNFFADNEQQKVNTTEERWIDEEDYEGQLSVDVYEDNDNNIVIKSTIAGVRPEDIDISINNEMITIKGKRQQEESVKTDNYFYQECYWGGFSRSIILPVEIQPDKVEASLKNGVLKVKLPKAKKSKEVSIRVKSND